MGECDPGIFHQESAFLDRLLWYLLYYKIILVVFMSIPLPWFFGIKRPILRWVSRSLIVRGYMLLAPPVSLAVAMVLSHFYRHHSGYDIPLSTAQTRAYLGWFNALFFFLIQRLYELVRGNPEPLFKVEEEALKREMMHFTPPPLPLLLLLTLFWRTLNPPTIEGLDNLPRHSEGPLKGQVRKNKIMFVGNHALWAIDSPLLLITLFKEVGIYVRSLAEHFWFVVPFLSEVTASVGGIDGTRENCDLLMEKEAPLLVYPGGAREAFKKRGEPKYEIMWGNHYGFVRLAVKHGYTLVPVSSVGTEDMWSILADVPVGWLMRAGKSGMGGKSLTAPFIVPRLTELQKIYFRIGKPIDTAQYSGDYENQEVLKAVRLQVFEQVKQGVDDLLEKREKDPERFVFKKAVTPKSKSE